MPPQLTPFPASELAHQAQLNVDGKLRKKPVDLAECQKCQLSQYTCTPEPKGPGKETVIVCREFVRQFRRCANGLTVETTAWNGEDSARAK